MSGPEVREEAARGCGFRKKGGLYLVCDGPGRPCGMFPIPLLRCPTCSGGIKPSRSWTWLDLPALLRGTRRECSFSKAECSRCSLSRIERAGLLWVGGKFYETPEAFNDEAFRMGISRRIPAVPRGFVAGQTWVLLAHRTALPCGEAKPGTEHDPDCQTCGGTGSIPAIFKAFLPARLEKVVEEDLSEEECEKLRKKGITPVAVRRVGDGADEGEEE